MIYYFDMDGVLADWVGGFERKFSDISYEEFNALPSSDRDVYRILIDGDSDFYASLDPFDHVVSVVKSLINSGKDVRILSSVGEDFPDLIIKAKLAWIRRHVDSDIECNFVNKSAEKAAYASANSILIDDRMKSVEPFSSAGGIGILYDARSDVDLGSLISLSQNDL